jgi:hypothetical protein
MVAVVVGENGAEALGNSPENPPPRTAVETLEIVNSAVED